MQSLIYDGKMVKNKKEQMPSQHGRERVSVPSIFWCLFECIVLLAVVDGNKFEVEVFYSFVCKHVLSADNIQQKQLN